MVEDVQRWWPRVAEYQADVKSLLERSHSPPVDKSETQAFQLKTRTQEVYLLRKRLDELEAARVDAELARLRPACGDEVGSDTVRLSAVDQVVEAYKRSEARRRKLELLVLKERAAREALTEQTMQNTVSSRTLSDFKPDSMDISLPLPNRPVLKRSQDAFVFNSLNDSFEEELVRDSNTCNNSYRAHRVTTISLL